MRGRTQQIPDGGGTRRSGEEVNAVLRATQTFGAELDQLAAMRHFLRDALAGTWLDPTASELLVLAASEATTQAVLSAYDGDEPRNVDLIVNANRRDVTVDVCDYGTWHPFGGPAEDRSMEIIYRVCDHVEITTLRGGTQVRLTMLSPNQHARPEPST